MGGTAGIALLAIFLLTVVPAAAQVAGPAAPTDAPVAVGEVAGDLPADLSARLSASLVSVVGETGRAPSPGEPADLVLRLEAREDPRGIALVLTLVRPGEKPVARLESVTTRASADARVRALARQLLAPPAVKKPPRESPAPVPPAPREPTPLEKCTRTDRAIFAGGVVSSLGMVWLGYEVIAFHKDLKGVPGGTLFGTVIVSAGSVVSSYALRRRARCFELHGCEPQRHLEIAPWAFTVGTLVGLFSGVVMGISGLTHTSEFSWGHDDDSEHSFTEEFSPYKEKIQYVYLASAGLELINLIVLRPLVWRAAIDRAAAGGAAGAAFAPSLFVAGDRRGGPAPALGGTGTF